MKKKNRNISSIILFLVGIGMMIAALAMFVPTILEYKKSRDTFDGLKQQYVSAPLQTETMAETEHANWWYEDVDIQMEELQKVNPDIVGWIRFDNIEILSYPVLYSGDDETYLKTDVYGNPAAAGCIFMEGACTPDFEDCHTILYGHNMKDLSMFGSLKKYKTEEFYEKNPYFTIYTEDMAYRYQIFAYRDVPETDRVYTVGFSPDDVFQEFIDEMIRSSYQDTGVSVKKEDKVLTLSTCSTEGKRFVVHAVRVAEYSKNDGKMG